MRNASLEYAVLNSEEAHDCLALSPQRLVRSFDPHKFRLLEFLIDNSMGARHQPVYSLREVLRASGGSIIAR